MKFRFVKDNPTGNSWSEKWDGEYAWLTHSECIKTVRCVCRWKKKWKLTKKERAWYERNAWQNPE